MIGKIYITGDKHGSFLPIFKMVEKNEINKEDILIIAGDAGYIWNNDYIYKVETLEQVFRGTVVFIDGNHENFDLLNGFEVVEWFGGRAHKLGERVFHLMRGEIYSIYGNNFFTFGGGRSTDQDRRIEGESWWKDEEPTTEELEAGYKKLMENIDEIDYVISHETPEFAREFISRQKEIDEDYVLPYNLEKWYNAVTEGKRFKKWYCGHMHVDMLITSTLRVLYYDIVEAGSEEKVKWA